MKTFARFGLAAGGTAILAGSVVIGALLWIFAASLPKIISTADYRPPVVSQIVMREGAEDKVVAEFFKERRYLVPVENVPKIVVNAFLAAEDDKFFEHQGISWVAITRAFFANLMAGHVVQGGSTITQQVVKSLFLSPERNLMRKIKEAILAGRIEKNLTKPQILYLYLNQIYLGNGAYGIQAASRIYYRKPVEELTLAEAAVIAGMPRAPGRCSPVTNPRCAKDRQLYVLKRMAETGFITREQMEEAAKTPLKVFFPPDTQDKHAAYLVEHVRRYLVQKYSEKAVYEEGMRIEVPSTPEHYRLAQASLKDGIRQVDKRRGFRGPIKKLKTDEEIEQYRKSFRDGLIRKKIPFLILTPEGQTDAKQAEVLAGLKDEEQLFDLGESYEAVVTRVDDARKTIHAALGKLEIQIPAAGWSWISSGKQAKSGALSKHFTRGDVVLAKLTKLSKLGSIADLEQDPQLQGALLSMDVRTGHVLAMIGGYDFEKSEFNRATQAQRQAGSAFKAVIYSAGLENGFTPASIIVDSPLVYDDEELGKWKPSNYDDKFYGDISFRQALIKSMNIPTIKIVQQLKVQNVIEYAKRLGLTNQFNADLSLSLGSANFTLQELLQVYALFPRLGRKVEPIYISRVSDRDGRVLEETLPKPLPAWVTRQDAEPPAFLSNAAPVTTTSAEPSPAPTSSAALSEPAKPVEPPKSALSFLPAYPLVDDQDQVLDPRVAYVMTHLMKEVVEFGTGAKAKVLGRPVAGKTGTTNDYHDAWFMGYTPYIVTGSWVGFDDQQTLGSGETGSAAAIPIWVGYMKDAVKFFPPDEFAIPRGINFAWINQKTGTLATPGAPGAVREAFIESTAPTEKSYPGATDTGSQSEFLKEDLE